MNWVIFLETNIKVYFERPYQLAGFREMELSTQIFLFDAIQKGLEIEILDEQEQFLKLQHGEHIEYVKNANMTSKDNYVVPLIMENKTVTKKFCLQQVSMCLAVKNFHLLLRHKKHICATPIKRLS